jgi:hypothetical protein
MVIWHMKPPQGRIQTGWRVHDLSGRRGEVVSERLIETNGAWYYTVVFDDGAREELPDFELTRLRSDAAAGEHTSDENPR